MRALRRKELCQTFEIETITWVVCIRNKPNHKYRLPMCSILKGGDILGSSCSQPSKSIKRVRTDDGNAKEARLEKHPNKNMGK